VTALKITLRSLEDRRQELQAENMAAQYVIQHGALSDAPLALVTLAATYAGITACNNQISATS
jgi:hypothetical protein